MTWTNHGHHIPGTSLDQRDRPVEIARCGGAGVCGQCSRESGMYKGKHVAPQTVPLVMYNNDGTRTQIGTADVIEGDLNVRVFVDPRYSHILSDVLDHLSIGTVQPELPFPKET